MTKAERFRRVRLNDHSRYLRNRYGHELPNDDAGRDDLYELLLTISLGDGADRKMRHAIGLWAKWMSRDEISQHIDGINRTPDYLRKRTARDLGERWGLTYEERQAWGIRTVGARIGKTTGNGFAAAALAPVPGLNGWQPTR
jgi:hypothetical protein